ncbi:MAG: hypothetical protein KDK12_02025 [Rhodobacteraceae bacterium]|nr:hypothetical protein [Paracoccaceae bacterium]
MTKPQTWLLPAVGAITYDAASLTAGRTFLTKALRQRGEISATIPPPAGQGPGAKPKTLVFDVTNDLWKPSLESPRAETTKALQEAVDWFNEESGKLATAHRVMAVKPIPYAIPVLPPMPEPRGSSRELWAEITSWFGSQAEFAAQQPEPVDLLGVVMPQIINALATVPFPVPIRLSLLDANFEGAIVLHMIVAAAARHPQVFIAAVDGSLQIDASRQITSAKHRRSLILSYALAVVSGLGMFLTDPQTRIQIVIQTGDPVSDFPSASEAEIFIGDGNFEQTLREIGSSAPDQLEHVAGVQFSGAL